MLQLGPAAPSGCEPWLCPALRARVTLSVVFGPQPQPCPYRQVIKATDNPLARAAAAGKPTEHLHAAAAHDLDQLQQLAVAEKTLASWVKDTAFGLSGEWLEAATRLAPAAPEQQPESVHKQLLAAEPPPTLAAPLSTAQRAGLRTELASKWRWSEGVEVRMSRLAVPVSLCSCFSLLLWLQRLLRCLSCCSSLLTPSGWLTLKLPGLRPSCRSCSRATTPHTDAAWYPSTACLCGAASCRRRMC